MASRSLPPGMICRPYITVDGEKIWAKDYGLKAFCFFVGNKKRPTNPRS